MQLSEDDYQELPRVQRDVRSKSWEVVQPSTPLPSIGEAPVVFHVPESFNSWTLLSESYYYMKFRLIYSDLSKLPKDRHVALQNFTPAICFSDQQMCLNGKLLEGHNGHGHYANYLQTLLYEPEETKTSTLKQSLWMPDPLSRQYDEVDIVQTTSENLKTRNRVIAESEPCEALCRLGFDLARCTRLLPPLTSMSITFNRAPAAFFVMAKAYTNDEGDKRIVLQIQEMQLFLRRVELHDACAKEFERMLASPRGLLYPFMAWRPRLFTIPTSVSSLDAVCFTNGLVPRRLIVVVVEAARVSGDVTKNSMVFAPNGVKTAFLDYDGQRLPVNAITYDDDNVLKAMLHCDEGMDFKSQARIDENMFRTTHFILAWDLSEGKSASSGLLNRPRVGTVKLHIDLKAAASSALCVLAMGEFDEAIQVLKDRTVRYFDLASYR